ncbi:hydroxylamine reductase [Clostridium tagluense]|uniref:hydroxylamine reductase n=1 Tax=Clostridium tagluense TaxID=360422 RepID=UPI001CF5C6DC|nr:hydroxylamine reductase [Clostridium tagluense]MCB2311748.1 hydroxylamine reductase [Clostridium tagluense]MCB2316530.1 hydroxylamine reductase [Clostridium tagluense]MCB2321328.1 hydroxylamine reductase [Clostridium tagluense]MCB2326399.1 hydroxylamine reductase [Clostridium tagluense]MCB2331122.1 hydroxylamine reductase [Clostridium tagluense]
MGMFCYQCQEASKGTGCTSRGVCGKTDDLANMQDLLIYVLKGISIYATRARKLGVENQEVNKFVANGLFMTITNANFDKTRFIETITKALELREVIKSELLNAGGVIEGNLPECATWTGSTSEFESKSMNVGVLKTENEDVRSLRELVIYGIKGIAAYTEHGYNLGYENNDIYAYMQKGLAQTTNDSLSVDELVALVLECGKYGVDAMALLDEANTTTYGNPEISKVNIGVRNNPAILISGHDLKDMEELLKQTEGSGVDVYTHSEMLPANYYPAFKKYSNLVGNYGNAWWKQDSEFESFNGPILMTTNCITPPKNSYKDRVYTTGAAGFDGMKHIPDRKDGNAKDFSAIIAHAKKCSAPIEIERGEIVGGFAHNQVLALADKVVDAVKTGAIKRFFVMAGCDGRMKGREYYTEFAKELPNDTVILTAGCAKYRYNKLELGDIGGIPRVLDAGQCNDSYSLVVIAMKLQEVFGLDDINELPITYNIAWYEQKAVIVLLALLYLGVKNIHLGPTLPAFLSPNVVNVLVENFGIAGIGTVEEDIKMFMA